MVKHDTGCSCTTVRLLILRASRLLNDDTREPVAGGEAEGIRWPNAILVDYLDEGLSLLQALRPDAFTKTVTFPLVAGRHQMLPPEFDVIVSLLGNSIRNDDGTFSAGAPIIEEDPSTARKIRGQGCVETSAATRNSREDCVTPAGGAEVRAYSMVAQDTNEFEVNPPIAVGVTAFVTARVVAQPCRHNANDLDACVGTPRKYDAALVDWILHRAYLMETESDFSPRASQAAMTRFYTSLDRGLRRESQFGSGYFLGKKGMTEGDENATARVQ